MTDDIATKIAELEATLHMSGLPAAAREAVEQQLGALRGQRSLQQSGGVNLGVGNTFGSVGDVVAGNQTLGTVDNQGRIAGVAVGVNYGRIVYGRDASEDERRSLFSYLTRLSDALYRLPLRGLEERLEQGDGVALPHIYVRLATSGRVVARRGGSKELRRYFQEGKLDQPLKEAFDPDFAPPDRAIIQVSAAEVAGAPGKRARAERVLEQALLAITAAHQHQRLVLLGEPGGGKSTFVRHLAWALAQRSLAQPVAAALDGWDEQEGTLPIVVSLRGLAGRLATTKGSAADVVFATIRAVIADYKISQVDELLNPALDRGAALILLDGLDEVPLDVIVGQVADRLTVLRAVRAFTDQHRRARCLITCRTRAFTDDLRELLGWQVETLAPFTLGQIRQFIPAWYGELVAKGQITQEQAERLSGQLLDSILVRPKLRAMAETPLLLTLMALILYNKGVLPRDRPQLYERVLELLLGQWDQVRDGQSIGDAIGLPDWDSERIRPLLDRLSYEAHLQAQSADGRGRLARGALYLALMDFFKEARVPRFAGTAQACLDYFEQRSGLLAPDTTDTYAFAHLTLQEHCAGRHIALGSEDPSGLVMQHRADDRWREPIMLGLGLVHPAVLNSVLSDLILLDEGGQPKPLDRWYRDLILAAEIGQDRGWDVLRTRPMVKVDQLQRDLRRGLVALLADTAQPLVVAERVRAGFLLGDLGDPRVPITLDDWRRELARVQSGDTSGYFCKVEAGTYTIGSADDDPDAEDDEKPQHQVTFDTLFWIARYPVTNEQWKQWVEQTGGSPSYFAEDTDLNRPNQPVVGVQWDWCNHFNAWLSERLGIELRLPTEFEWEAAARGGDARRYPWGDEWQDDRAATGEDQETRGAQYTVPVGCYPAGAAPCGALDMAGNVWEWTASEYRAYPGAKKPFTENQYRVLRGGDYSDSRNRVRCGARGWILPSDGDNLVGFRIVVAPRAH